MRVPTAVPEGAIVTTRAGPRGRRATGRAHRGARRGRLAQDGTDGHPAVSSCSTSTPCDDQCPLLRCSVNPLLWFSVRLIVVLSAPYCGSQCALLWFSIPLIVVLGAPYCGSQYPLSVPASASSGRQCSSQCCTRSNPPVGSHRRLPVWAMVHVGVYCGRTRACACVCARVRAPGHAGV
jgi:hypothetical protein